MISVLQLAWIIPLTALLLLPFARRSAHHLPPGPKPRLISGNMADLEERSWLSYTKWKDLYGEIVFIRLFSQKVIILNTVTVANTLLEKRSHIYSSRPYTPMLNLLGWGTVGVFLPYGAAWRRQRKIIQQNFRQAALAKYYADQTDILKRFVHNLIVSRDDDHWKYVNNAGAELMLKIVYGYDVESLDDPALSNADHSMQHLVHATMPGYSVVNALKSIPLSWIPYILPFFPATKRSIAIGRKYTDDVFNVQFDDLKKKMTSGMGPPSITTDLLHSSTTEEEEADIRDAAGSAIAAGSDTTAATFGVFLLAMVLHPEVQKRAHEEIMSVVGAYRFPEHSDRPRLPYLEAIYREVLRWYPVTPIGLLHEVIEDDVYEGYHIPKGTSIIANIWAMTHDDTVHKDPFTFNPDRYFVDGKLNDDSHVLAFGFGRRVCSGLHLASATVWITMAYILANLEISKAKDADGNVIDVDPDNFSAGHVSHPEPFPFHVTPRSGDTKNLTADI